MFVVSHEAKRSGVPGGQNGTPLRSVPHYKRNGTPLGSVPHYERLFRLALITGRLYFGAREFPDDHCDCDR